MSLLTPVAPSLPSAVFWRFISRWNFFISVSFCVQLEALTNGEVRYCRSSALCGQAIRTEIINTESGLPVSCWMKLEGVQIQKDFLAYHFWATCSNSHLEGQLPASISDCLTALTRALRASLHFSLSRLLGLGCGALLADRKGVRKGIGCCTDVV